MDHLVVGECLDKMLRISVNHAKSQMVVMIASVNRVFFHIGQGVVHPAHVPFHMKAQTLTLRLPGDTRQEVVPPRSSRFREQTSGSSGLKAGEIPLLPGSDCRRKCWESTPPVLCRNPDRAWRKPHRPEDRPDGIPSARKLRWRRESSALLFFHSQRPSCPTPGARPSGDLRTHRGASRQSRPARGHPSGNEPVPSQDTRRSLSGAGNPPDT